MIRLFRVPSWVSTRYTGTSGAYVDLGNLGLLVCCLQVCPGWQCGWFETRLHTIWIWVYSLKRWASDVRDKRFPEWQRVFRKVISSSSQCHHPYLGCIDWRSARIQRGGFGICKISSRLSSGLRDYSDTKSKPFCPKTPSIREIEAIMMAVAKNNESIFWLLYDLIQVGNINTQQTYNIIMAPFGYCSHRTLKQKWPLCMYWSRTIDTIGLLHCNGVIWCQITMLKKLYQATQIPQDIILVFFNQPSIYSQRQSLINKRH